MSVRARVRGIYTTSLTQLLLEAGHDVVQASDPIRNRFDVDLPDEDHDVELATTDDRQGVGVEGDPDAVETTLSHLRAVGVDTLVWQEPAPTGAVFDGVVHETLGSGAIVDLGDGGEGFLPFRNAKNHIGDDDAVRVQVTEAAPPWDDDRPLLDTELKAYAGLATLVPGQEGTRVDTRDDAAGRELAGMTDLLGADVPDGWGVRWSHSATEASMDALNAALTRAAERADTLDEVVGTEIGEPGRLVAPTETAWCWFGRESRFALDEHRRAVTTTMPGHHRIKAAHESASAGVDFAEALCAMDGRSEFPFGVVTQQFGPVTGDTVRIGHGKPDGRLILLGRGEVVDYDGDEGTLSVERQMSPGGNYDALGVPRESGDTALTKFREGRWWYPTVYRDAEGERKGTYVNVCTPVECFPDTIRYVDLHVDVVKHADGRVERVDDDELDEAVEAGQLSEALAEKARSVATAIENAL
jgi:Ribonuclease G/E